MKNILEKEVDENFFLNEKQINKIKNSNFIQEKRRIQKNDKLCFEVNVSDLSIIENLNKFFPLVSITLVPIGYNDTFTYFAVFLANEKFSSGSVSYKTVLERLKTQREEVKNFEYKCQFKEQ